MPTGARVSIIWHNPGGGGRYPKPNDFSWSGDFYAHVQVARLDIPRGQMYEDWGNPEFARLLQRMQRLMAWLRRHGPTGATDIGLANWIEGMAGASLAEYTGYTHLAGTLEIRPAEQAEALCRVWEAFVALGRGPVLRRWMPPRTAMASSEAPSAPVSGSAMEDRVLLNTPVFDDAVSFFSLTDGSEAG